METPQSIFEQIKNSSQFIQLETEEAETTKAIIALKKQLDEVYAKKRKMLDKVTIACVEDVSYGFNFHCPTKLTASDDGEVKISKSTFGYCDDCPHENICQSKYRTWTD